MRRFINWAFLVGTVAGFAGCNPEFSTAEYDNGVRFCGVDGEIDKVEWSRPKGIPQGCPLHVRLKDGTELDDAHFSSPKFMRDRGGHVQNRIGTGYDLMVFSPDAAFWSEYKQDALVSVGVNMQGCRKHSHSVTVGDKTVRLPTSESELFRDFGTPRNFSKSEGF